MHVFNLCKKKLYLMYVFWLKRVNSQLCVDMMYYTPIWIVHISKVYSKKNLNWKFVLQALEITFIFYSYVLYLKLAIITFGISIHLSPTIIFARVKKGK